MEQQLENNPVEQKVQEQVITENKSTESATKKEESSPKSSQDWQKFREARAQERKQAEELARQAEKSAAEAAALKAALEAIVSKPTPQQNQNNYYEQEETEEQKIDRRVNEALAKRDAEYERQRKQQEQQEYPQKLQSTFSDFNQVCTTENLDYLEYHYPEVAEAFKHSPDGYQKWAAVYKAVKRFVPNTDGRKEMARAEANLSKPQSISSPTASTSGQGVGPTRLDESRKRSNWERMQRQMKGLN